MLKLLNKIFFKDKRCVWSVFKIYRYDKGTHYCSSFYSYSSTAVKMCNEAQDDQYVV